ncbi:MAG: hypothetical protein ACPGVU_12300 [Limisphaerales bacterium]
MSRTVNSHYALDHIHWDRGGESDENLGEDELAGENGENGASYSHPEVEQAAEWVAGELQQRQFNADFSLESLHEIDRFFAEFARADLPGYQDFFADDLSYRSFAMGAYVGEVLRRSDGGQWQADPADPLIEVNIELALSEEVACQPMRQVLLRLNDGPASSFAKFAGDLGFEVPGEAKIEEAPKPEEPSDFVMRGFLTLWYREREEYNAPEYHLAADTTACVNLLGYFSFLESKPTPSLKTMTTLTEDDGFELPESQAGGSILKQLSIFCDPELDPEFWNLVEADNQLCVELGSARLSQFKDAVTRIFLGRDCPILGTLDTSIQFWPKADISKEESGPENEASAEPDDQSEV